MALATALLANGNECAFACREQEGCLKGEITEAGFGLHWLPGLPNHGHGKLGCSEAEDLQAVLDAAGTGWDWVVVDHYALGEDWETGARGFAKQVLVIDDLAEKRHVCDLLLNQNLISDYAACTSKVPGSSRLALGPMFALLRKEFHRSEPPRLRSELKNVLVCLGGSSNGLDSAMLAAADAIGNLGLSAVYVGGSGELAEELGERWQQSSTQLGQQMAEADLMIGAPGSTSWERAALGLPAILLEAAVNQQGNMQALVAEDCAWNAGKTDQPRHELAQELHRLLARLQSEPELMEKASSKAAALTDGRGAQRVAKMMGKPALVLRLAAEEDASLLFDWANDEGVRSSSLNPAPIPWEDHVAWFHRRLADPSSIIFIATLDGSPAGVVRFQGEIASYALAPEMRGRGLGPEIVREGTLRRLAAGGRRPVAAIVKPDNEASAKACLEAGYQRGDDGEHEGQKVHRFLFG